MSAITASTSYDAVPTEKGHEVLADLAERDPDNIYAAVSGGDDSITALHFAHTSPEIELDGVVHMDTGVGIGGTREFVEAQCEKLGLDLIVLENSNARPGHERYKSLVKRFGFPGANPIAHSQMWKNLKDKPLGRFQSNLAGNLALISGVRKHESDNRYERLNETGVQEVGGITWASPLVDFTDQDMKSYRKHHEVDDNDVAALLCTSGECLCGSYGDRNNLPLIEQYYPETAHQIYSLEMDVLEQVARGEVRKEYALWAHGSVKKGEYDARTDAAQTGLMCSDCSDRCPDSPYEMTGNPLSPAERFLQENDLGEFWNWYFYCAVCDRVVDDPLKHRNDVHPFDEDHGLEGEWDMRQIDPGASHQCGEIITEPNGWNLHINQLTTDEKKAENRKHSYYYEDIAISHCTDHDHNWEEYNDGPVKKCTECFAFNLSDYEAENPGPPVTEPQNTADAPLTPDAEEAQRINQQLSDFAT